VKLRKSAVVIDGASSVALVERPAPNAAPTAFRIWAAGENIADDGAIFFTEESAALLMAEQASRGRTYSIDFDHLSLATDRQAEAGRAAGWHSLEVRADVNGKPELWAVAVDWCADVRAGLEENPPRWRFFSPAFRVNDKGEVISYVNLALCINPMTHGIPQLASASAVSTKGSSMNRKAMLAALAAMAAGADGEKKEALTCALSFLSDDEKEEKGDGSDKKEADSGESEEKKDDSEKSEEKSHADGEDEKKDDEKEHAIRANAAKPSDDIVRAMADDLVKANKRIEALEVEKMLDARQDLPESVRKWCAAQPAAVVKSFLASAPKQAATRDEKPIRVASTGPALLEGPEREAMDQAMGLKKHNTQATVRREDGSFELHTSARPAQKGAA
jgi:phage I-like protein